MNSLFLILFLICVLGSLGANNRDKAWKAKKSKCEKQECVHLIPEEAYNCVNQCTSQKCFADIYGREPLEDGEIDNARSRAFVICLRDEVREEKRQRLNFSPTD
eukprot:scaffold2066_cov229-Ochromonas_danica.AAC.4